MHDFRSEVLSRGRALELPCPAISVRYSRWPALVPHVAVGSSPCYRQCAANRVNGVATDLALCYHGRKPLQPFSLP
ncbi:unnamed protein product [Arctogadus glacialis]